jgi:hypothetical protein
MKKPKKEHFRLKVPKNVRITSIKTAIDDVWGTKRVYVALGRPLGFNRPD